MELAERAVLEARWQVSDSAAKALAMWLYPVALKIAGRRCVVVGGGNVAERKVASLAECGADIRVVSPELTAELAARAARGEIEVLRRMFLPDDLDGALLAIAAADDRSVNEAVKAAGARFGVLVNVVDVPELCDFYVPASFRRGDLQITIGTGGASPALAKRLRVELERQFGPEYGPYVELLGRLRRALKAQVPNRERRNEAERAFLSSPALSLAAAGKMDEAERVLEECLSKFVG